MYPVAPLLLSPSRHVEHHGLVSFCYRRFEVSVATTTFVFATSLRTMMMTPLHHFERIGQSSHDVEEGGCYGLFAAILHKMDSIIDGLELFSHVAWEDAARQSGMLRGDADNDTGSDFASVNHHHNVPEIDLNLLVPCKIDVAKIKLLGIGTINGNDDNEGDDHDLTTMECHDDESPITKEGSSCIGTNSNIGDVCRLRNVITRNLLVEYAKLFYDESFDLSTHPIILRNLWPPESFDETAIAEHDVSSESCPTRFGRTTSRKLTPDAILNDPQLSNLILPNYFSDAANKTGYAALVPDVSTFHLTLSQFMKGILSGDLTNAKIGTQVIIEKLPELRNEIIPPKLAKELFGWSTVVDDYRTRIKNLFNSEEIGSWVMKLLPPMSYYPVFIASNQQASDGTTHPRTDLHAEPIGNIASQLHGMRRWTLVPTKWSGLLRPTVSRHRGYFFSNIDPIIELPKRLDSLPLAYTCITRRGDSVWIPPWVCYL